MPNLLQKSAKRPVFSPKESFQLRAFFVIIHVLSFIACFSNTFPINSQLLMALIVLMSSLFYLFNAKNSHAYTLSYQEQKGWKLNQVLTQNQSLTILPTTILTTFVIIIHSKLPNGKRRNFIILRDTLSEPEYRYLLVLLKISSTSQSHKPST